MNPLVSSFSRPGPMPCPPPHGAAAWSAACAASRQAAVMPLAQAPACSSNRQGRAGDLPVLAAGEGDQFGGAEFMTELALGVGDIDGELLEAGG